MCTFAPQNVHPKPFVYCLRRTYLLLVAADADRNNLESCRETLVGVECLLVCCGMRGVCSGTKYKYRVQ